MYNFISKLHAKMVQGQQTSFIVLLPSLWEESMEQLNFLTTPIFGWPHPLLGNMPTKFFIYACII